MEAHRHSAGRRHRPHQHMLGLMLWAVAAAVAATTATTHPPAPAAPAASGGGQPLPQIVVAPSGTWPKPLPHYLYVGDIRAVATVPSGTNSNTSVTAQVFWRRRDANPAGKAVLVTNAASGAMLSNVSVSYISNDCGLVSFQPQPGSDTYHIYWLPHYQSGGGANLHFHWYNGSNMHGSTGGEHLLASDPCAVLLPPSSTTANVTHFETRDAFHGFTDMELVATTIEQQALVEAADSNNMPFVVFGETRDRPSRVFTGPMVPARWALRPVAPVPTLGLGSLTMGEYVVFQVGVYAALSMVADLGVEASLSPTAGNTNAAPIPASAFHCFNFGGVDNEGAAFTKTVDLRAGHVAVLWIGLQLPATGCQNTVFSGAVTVTGTGTGNRVSSVKLPLTLSVSGAPPVVDKGDSNVYNLGRLRWLDSTLGIDDEVIAPFVPVGSATAAGSLKVSVLNKDIALDATTGLPSSAQIKSTAQRKSGPKTSTWAPLQSGGVRFEVFSTAAPGSPLPYSAVSPAAITSQTNSTVAWAARFQAEADGSTLVLSTSAALDFDSYGEFNVTLQNTGSSAVALADVRLRLPMANMSNLARVGMASAGSKWAENTWRWSLSTGDNAIWAGRPEAGVYLKLKGAGDEWESPMYSKDYPTVPFIPTSWGGPAATEGATGANMTADGQIVCFSGPRTLQPGQAVSFLFDLAFTPSKPVNWGAHWVQRYFQVGYGTSYLTPAEVKAKGATVLTLHQGVPGVINGSLCNPYINYPFLPDTVDFLDDYVRQAHALNITQVKYYYTIRELSNHAAELFALLALWGEVIIDTDPYNIPQPGYCQAWDCHGGAVFLQEHILTNYSACWQQGLSNGEWDAAVCDIGTSRWFNYYVEGLQWSILQKPHINGIYYDGINFDRRGIRRIRKTSLRAAATAGAPQPLLDVHTGRASARPPAVGYLSHFPYVDSLWNGEGFDFSQGPFYWLVEVSGLIHGLTADRLGGSTPSFDHRGMLYGMTQRNSEAATGLWAFWDSVDIARLTVVGWWEPDSPVTLKLGSSPAPNSTCEPSHFEVTPGAYHEACGGAPADLGINGTCGGSASAYPALTPAEAEKICCELDGQDGRPLCAGFSLSNARDAQGRGNGCIKLNVNCGVRKVPDYTGYLAPPRSVPCSTNPEDRAVLATVYTDFASTAVVAIASHCSAFTNVTLNPDFAALGFGPDVDAAVPAIAGVQFARAMSSWSQPLALAPNEGVIVVLTKRQ